MCTDEAPNVRRTELVRLRQAIAFLLAPRTVSWRKLQTKWLVDCGRMSVTATAAPTATATYS